MSQKIGVMCVTALLLAAGFTSASPDPAAAPPEKVLETWAGRFLAFDPESRVAASRASESAAVPVPGFAAYKVRRTGRYPKLAVDRTFYVSEDGKWVFAGDALPNRDARAVRSNADLEWLSRYLSKLFRASAIALLSPERDQAGLKGVFLSSETGYGRVRLPGYVSPDGRVFLQGTLWDLRADPRAERRRRIDPSVGRATGPADAAVTMIEYADLECGYCRYRGKQMDRLLEANAGVARVRRHYKFFPLWLAHVWAMKAASAADCFFQLEAPAFHRFKNQVYGRQETLSVSGIDELAVSHAQVEGIAAADFLSCYLREESFARVLRDMEEGYRLGVNSTPTYYVDGTEIVWSEDKVMEDFLRSLFPKLKGITYEVPKK